MSHTYSHTHKKIIFHEQKETFFCFATIVVCKNSNNNMNGQDWCIHHFQMCVYVKIARNPFRKLYLPAYFMANYIYLNWEIPKEKKYFNERNEIEIANLSNWMCKTLSKIPHFQNYCDKMFCKYFSSSRELKTITLWKNVKMTWANKI